MTGSINDTCQMYGGQCHCKAGVTGRTCDQCIVGFYNFSSQGCSGNPLYSKLHITVEPLYNGHRGAE